MILVHPLAVRGLWGIIVFSNPLFNAVFHRLFRRRELSTSPGGACCGSAELYYKSSANSVHTFTW